VAAVRALAEAGTERARAALRRLTRDHDAEVAAVAAKGAGGA
jgi:HEAT repeat protein